MISRISVSATLLCFAGAAFAQAQAPTTQPAPSGPQAAIQQTAMAFGQCLETGVQGVAATVTPEAGATSVLGGCASQRRQLEGAIDALIATLPADQQAAAREHARTQLAGAQAQVAAAITRLRAAPAPAQ
jgi:hypothetical protein